MESCAESQVRRGDVGPKLDYESSRAFASSDSPRDCDADPHCGCSPAQGLEAASSAPTSSHRFFRRPLLRRTSCRRSNAPGLLADQLKALGQLPVLILEWSLLLALPPAILASQT